MIDRRRFIETSVAGALAAGFALPARPPIHGRADRSSAVSGPPLYAVLLDERFAQAQRFGTAAERHGLPVRRVNSDLTQLWYAQLQPLWRRELRPLAGLTSYAALFCLAELARDPGMRIVYHGTHTPLGQDEIEHVLEGPRREAPQSAPDVHVERSAREAWTARLAAWIAWREARIGWGQLRPVSHARAIRCPPAGASLARGLEQPLYSWVIAQPARDGEGT